MATIIKKMTNPPQKGSVTHHHDQSITFVNLSTTNATPSNPATPTESELFAIIFFLLCLKKTEILPCFQATPRGFQSNPGVY